MKNEVWETRAQSQPRNNWECQKWEKKKDEVSAIESSLLTIATAFCNFSPYHWAGMSNR